VRSCLWHELHAGAASTDEQVLGLGALCALVAAGVQGMLSGRAVSALRRGEASEAEARSRIAIGQRIGAALLAVALICMAVARYV
jgi:F0F1-type ATP synthase membrane subunit c/vacuolar-type H+-ATPase subunit K